MALRPGEVFGPFMIEKELGRGGMGIVFQATDSRLARKIALKVISRVSDGSVASDEAVHRLLREARAAASFRHPGAVVVFEVGELEGTAFIAMEFIDGCTLREAARTVNLHTRVTWLSAVADVLTVAHAAGIVHRDIKPDNVMIDSDGVVKLLDFGIARSARGPTDAPATHGRTPLPTITREGVPIGTPQYMAPEQIQGFAVDARSDQFSWAVMAYEVLTDHLPFDGADLLAMSAAILLHTPRPPSAWRPELAPADGALLRALAKAPEERFPSLAAAAAAVGTSLGVVPAAAASGRVQPPVTSDRLAADALAPTIESDQRLHEVGGARWTTGGERSGAPPPLRDATLPSPLPRKRTLASVAGALAILGAVAGAYLAVHASRRPSTVGAPHSAASSDAPALRADAGEPSAVIRVTDWTVPPSTNDEARLAFRDALSATRGGSAAVARELFQKAIASDPEHAAASAHVWLAMLSVFRDRAEARRELEAARRQKQTLSAPSMVVLEALDEVAAGDVGGMSRASTKLEDAIRSRPGDALVWLLLGTVQTFQRDFAKALASLDRALSLDPQFGAAWLTKALAFEEANRLDDALAAYASCIEGSDATSCVSGRLRLLSVAGRCDEVRADAERFRLRHPSNPDGLRWLASVDAHAEGLSPRVAERLAQARTKVLPKEAEFDALRDELFAASLTGDFERVLATAKDLDARIAADERLERHGDVALSSAEALLELRRPLDAGKVANAFLERRSLYTLPTRLEDDPTPRLLAIAASTKVLDERAVLRIERAWRSDVSPDPFPRDADELWFYSDAALGASLPRAAIAARSAPTLRQAPSLQAALFAGAAFLAANEPSRAKAELARATNVCLVYRAPIAAVRAHALLAEALEKTGDVGAACRENAVVLARWGGARGSSRPRPPSVSVSAALTRKKRLQCRGNAAE